MKKKVTEIGTLGSKSICVALTLILGMSLFAAGAFAELGCGQKCCCHRSTTDMHHSKLEIKKISANPCNRDPIIPCDLETAKSLELPDFIIGSVGANQPNTVMSANINTAILIDKPVSRAIDPFQFVRTNARSAPIYLQNASFLI